VAAAAESGDTDLLGHAEEPASGTHGIGSVLGVATVAVMAGDAGGGVDTLLPGLDCFAPFAALARMALDADTGIFLGNGREGEQKECDQKEQVAEGGGRM